MRADRRPYATILLVLASILVTLFFQVRALNVINYLDDLVASSPLNGDYWKLVTQLFVYWPSTAYEVAALAAIFLFGWLLERRHGAWAPLLVFFVGGVAGSAAVLALDPHGGTMGANSSALALLAAWSMRDILARRRGEEDDADLLGVLAIAIVLVLLPAVSTAPELAGRADRRRGRDPARAAAGPPAAALALARRAIVPGSPGTSRPTVQPSISAGTAASRPPEVIASHSSRRRGSGTASAQVVNGSASAPVPARAARERVLGLQQLQHAVDRGHGGRVDLRRQPAGRRQLVDVAQQPEAGDVGERVRAGRAGVLGRAVVERRHHLDRPRDERRRRPARA